MCFNIHIIKCVSPSSQVNEAFLEYADSDASKQMVVDDEKSPKQVDEMVEDGKKIEDNVEHKADEMNEAVEKEVGFLEVIVFLNSCVGINSSFL